MEQLELDTRPLRARDVVSLLPPSGCCNSTHCFGEWVVVTSLNLPSVEELYLVSPRHLPSGEWRVIRLREVNEVLEPAGPQDD